MSVFSRIKHANPAAKSSVAYTICNVIQKSISFLTLPLFTRLLTTTQYGQYTIYTTWSAIFTILITLNLSFGTFDKAMVKYEDEKNKYVSSIHFLVFAISILFLAIYLPLSNFINEFVSLPTPIMLLMVGEIVCCFAVQTWCSKEKFEYHWKGVVLVTLLIAFLAPLSGLVLVLNFRDNAGYARIYGYAIVNIVVGLFFIIYNIAKGRVTFSKKFWKYALSFNIPLIPYYFSQIIFNQSDRIMIEKLQSVEEAGIYGVAYSLALLLMFVVTSINSAYVPWLYRKIRDKGHRANWKISILILCIVSVLIMFVIWIAPEAMLIIAPEDYQGAVNVVPPVALSLVLLLLSQYSINIQFYYEQKWRLVFASILSAGLNIGLNFWLIPIYGYVAAGYTTLISYIVFALCNYLCIIDKVKKGGELHGIFNFWLLCLIFLGFAGLSYAGVLLYSNRILRLSIFVAMIVLTTVFAVIFRKKIMVLIHKLSNKEKEEPAQVVEEGKVNESN